MLQSSLTLTVFGIESNNLEKNYNNQVVLNIKTYKQETNNWTQLEIKIMCTIMR